MKASELFGERRSGSAQAMRIRGTMLMGILALAKFGQADSVATQSVTVRGEHVNVRSRPSLNGEVIMQLNAGTVLSLVEKIDSGSSGSGKPASWGRIKLPSSARVWVHGGHVKERAVAANVLNLRAGPSESYGILGQLKRGDQVNIVSKKGDWLEIEAPEQTSAYVASDYLVPIAPAIVASTVPPALPVAAQAVPAGQPNSSDETQPTKASQPAAPAVVNVVQSTEVSAPAETAQSTPPMVQGHAVTNAQPPQIATTDPVSESKASMVEKDSGSSQPVSKVDSQPVVAVVPKLESQGANLASGAPAASAVQAPPVSSETSVLPVKNVDVPPTDAKVASTSEAVGSVRQSGEPIAEGTATQASPLANTVSRDPNPQPIGAMPQPSLKVASPKAVADDGDWHGPSHLWVRPEAPRNEFSIGYRFGLNLSASFKGSGTFQLPSGQPGIYDDGFVLPSSRGNTDNYTWNWGYQNDSQYDQANDRLIMSRASSVQGASDFSSSSSRNQVHHGVEAAYHRVLFQEENGPLRIGIQGALNYMPFGFRENNFGFGNVVNDRFAYALGGVRPPPAPYSGTFEGPGPLIDDNPQPLAPETVLNGATITSRRRFDADVYGVRVGPRISGELFPRVIGMADAGLAVTMMNGRFSYRDRLDGVGAGPMVFSGAREKLDVAPGWYVGAGLVFQVLERVGLFYQVQYQSSSSFREKLDEREVLLNLGSGIYQTVGISYAF